MLSTTAGGFGRPRGMCVSPRTLHPRPASGGHARPRVSDTRRPESTPSEVSCFDRRGTSAVGPSQGLNDRLVGSVTVRVLVDVKLLGDRVTMLRCSALRR